MRKGAEATYWWEKPTAVPEQKTQQAKQPEQAIQQNITKTFDWDTWCSGGMSLVFSNEQGALNVGTLANIKPPCEGGTVAIIEPWRVGCTAPQATNANCNPAKAWLANNWQTALQWLVASQWYEGSLWYRPWETLPENTVQSTCVKAITPAGTVIASVEGYDPCKGVDRQPTNVSLTDPVTDTLAPADVKAPVVPPTPDLSGFVKQDELNAAVSKIEEAIKSQKPAEAPDTSNFVKKDDFNAGMAKLEGAIQSAPAAPVDWVTAVIAVVLLAAFALVIWAIRKWVLPKWRARRVHTPATPPPATPAHTP